jgi:hypothetical protein
LTALDYHDPRPSGNRRRAHPLLFPIGLILAALFLSAAIPYIIGLIVVFMRGAGQN